MATTLIAQPEKFGATSDQGGQQHTVFSGNAGSSAGSGRRLPAVPADVPTVTPAAAPKHGSATSGASRCSASSLSRRTAELARRTPPESGNSSNGGVGESSPDSMRASAGLSSVHLAAESPVAGLDSGCLSCDDNAAAATAVGTQPSTIEDRLLHSYKALNTAVDSKIQAVLSCFSLPPAAVDGSALPDVRPSCCDSSAGSCPRASTSDCATGVRSRRSCTSSTDSEAGVASLTAAHSHGSSRLRPVVACDTVPRSVSADAEYKGSATIKSEHFRLPHHLRLQLPTMPARTSSCSSGGGSGGCCDSPRAGSAPTSTASPGRRSASDDCCSSSSSSVDSAPSSWSFATADAFAPDVMPAAAADLDGSNDDAASVATDVLLQTADDDIAMVEALLSSDSEAPAGASGGCSTSHSSSRSSFDYQRLATTAGSSPCGTPRSFASSTGTLATMVVPVSAVASSSSRMHSRSSEASRSSGPSSTPVEVGTTPTSAVGTVYERRTLGVDCSSHSENSSGSAHRGSRCDRSVHNVGTPAIVSCSDGPLDVSLPQLRKRITAPVLDTTAAALPQGREAGGSAEQSRTADGRLATAPAAGRCARPDLNDSFGGANGLVSPSTLPHRDDVDLLPVYGQQRPPDCPVRAGSHHAHGIDLSRGVGSSTTASSMSSSSSPACGPRLSVLRTEQRSTSRGRESAGRSPARQVSADAASPSFGRAMLRSLSTRSRRDGIAAGAAAAATGKTGSGIDDLSTGRAPIASRQHHVHDPPDAVTGFHRTDGGRFSLRSRTLADGAQALGSALSSQRPPAAAVEVRSQTGTVSASRGGGPSASAAVTPTRPPMLLGGALRTSASMERLEQEKAIWRRRKSYDPRRAVAAAASVAAASSVPAVGSVSTVSYIAPASASLDAPSAADHVTPIVLTGQRRTASLSSQPSAAMLPHQQQQTQPPVQQCSSARPNAAASATTSAEMLCNRSASASAAAHQSQQQPTHPTRRHHPGTADAALVVDDDEEVFGTSHELEQANFRTSREQEIAKASSALAANLGLLSSRSALSVTSGGHSGGSSIGLTKAGTATISTAAVTTGTGKEHWPTRSLAESTSFIEQTPRQREFPAETAAVGIVAAVAASALPSVLLPAEEQQHHQQLQVNRAHLLARQRQVPLSPLPAPAVAESSAAAVPPSAASTAASAGSTTAGSNAQELTQLHAGVPIRGHPSRAAENKIATSVMPTAEARPSAFRRCRSDIVTSPLGASVTACPPSITNCTPGRTSPSALPNSLLLQPSLAKRDFAADDVDEGDEPYNAVVMASIQRLSARLSVTSHRLLTMLRDRLPPSAAAGLSAGSLVPGAATSHDAFDLLDAAAGRNRCGSSSGGASALCCTELGSALSSLRQVEQNIGALERSLLLHHGPLALVTSTSACQDQSRYLAELRQLRSDITGFKPVEDDAPVKTNASAHASGPSAANSSVGSVGTTASSGAAFFYAGPSSSAPTSHSKQPQVTTGTTAPTTTVGAPAVTMRSAALKAGALPAQSNGVGPKLGSGVSVLLTSRVPARKSFY